MSIESSPVKVRGSRPEFTDADARSAGDSQTRSRTRTLDKPPVSRFIKDLARLHDNTPVFANHSVDSVIVERLRREALLGAKAFAAPPVKQAHAIDRVATPVIAAAETQKTPRKSRLQKALGRVAALRSRTPQPAPAPKTLPAQKLKAQPTPEVTRTSSTKSFEPSLTAESMTPDALVLEEAEIILEDYHVDIADQPLTADLMTFDAPALEEVEIFHNTNLVGKIHVPTQPKKATETGYVLQEAPRASQAAGSFWTERRNVMRAKKVWLAAMIGATALATAGSGLFSHGIPVKTLESMPAASMKAEVSEPAQYNQLAAPLVAHAAEAPAHATAAAIPKTVSAPAAVVNIPAPAPVPVETAVHPSVPVKPHRKSWQPPKPIPRSSNGKGASGPSHGHKVPSGGSEVIHFVTGGAGDHSSQGFLDVLRSNGAIPDGVLAIPTVSEKDMAPFTPFAGPLSTDQSVAETRDALRANIKNTRRLHPNARIIIDDFSEGNMAGNDIAHELVDAGVPVHVNAYGNPESAIGMQNKSSAADPLVKSIMDGAGIVEHPDIEDTTNIANNRDMWATTAGDGALKTAEKGIGIPKFHVPEDTVHQQPTQSFKIGSEKFLIFGDPDHPVAIPPNATDIQGDPGPEFHKFRPDAPANNVGGAPNRDGQPPAPDAPQPPVRDALTGVPAAPPPAPVPESEHLSAPSNFGEPACDGPNGPYWTPAGVGC